MTDNELKIVTELADALRARINGQVPTAAEARLLRLSLSCPVSGCTNLSREAGRGAPYCDTCWGRLQAEQVPGKKPRSY